MEFRLTYEGLLLGDKRNRPEHKHHIRRAFHKQLARLWKIHPLLKREHSCTIKIPGWVVKGEGLADEYVFNRIRNEWASVEWPIQFPGTEWYSVRGMKLIDWLGNKYKMNNFRFVPLVRSELALVTSIHVLFLRPDRPGSVLNSGDIDGRIKTLFDALQVPKVGQLQADAKPAEDEDPFFCLVDDDQLITHVSVETDMLLEQTGRASDHPENDARLVITVKIHPYEHHPGNQGF